jgi:flagellar assembly protein FliH
MPATSTSAAAAKNMSEPADKAPERWSAPAIDGSDQPGFMTAEGLERLQKQAYDEAYAEGLEAGRVEGAREIAERVGHVEEILEALTEPLKDVDEQVEQQLVELAMTLVKQLFRREVSIEPAHVIGVVREAIQMLPVASRNVRVLLHPEDARLVLETLSPTDGECAWTVVEDPLVNRGGCRVVTDTSRIDATTEARLHAAISNLLGDQRGDEGEDAE